MIQDGALFAWFFHYMPVGNEAAPVLMPSADQRAWMIQQIRHFRQTKPIFTIDFQNDAEYVGGCIAGGRRYLHINANGDVDPCVFIHYSNMNIREHTLLEALQSPLFKAYYHNQPFNGNMLRPCRCWKIRRSCRGWSDKAERFRPICNHRRARSIYARNVRTMPSCGKSARNRSGRSCIRKRTKEQ